MEDKKERVEREGAEAREKARPETPPEAEIGSPEEALTLPRSEVESLRAQAAKAEEYLDLARRTKADFINWQARARREQDEQRRLAAEGLARELVSVLDALTHTLAARPEQEEGRRLLEAVRLIEKEMLRILAKVGMRPMETAGRTFDPYLHEALEVFETGDFPDGLILEETRRGWMLHDRVLRPAQVKIARGPRASAGDDRGPDTGQPPSSPAGPGRTG